MHLTATTSPVWALTLWQENSRDLVVIGAPASWMNLRHFFCKTWLEVRKTRSSLPHDWPRGELHHQSHLQSRFKLVSHLDLFQQWQPRHGPNSVPWSPFGWNSVNHASHFYLFRTKSSRQRRLQQRGYLSQPSVPLFPRFACIKSVIQEQSHWTWSLPRFTASLILAGTIIVMQIRKTKFWKLTFGDVNEFPCRVGSCSDCYTSFSGTSLILEVKLRIGSGEGIILQ